MEQQLLEVAIEVARRAGALLKERFGGPAHGVSSKSTATDLVSDADRDSEALILEFLQRHRPEDSVLSEEGGGSDEGAGLRWIVDPLDGTVNFLFGIPIWAVSIAVEDDDGLIAAVTYDPNLDETFTAIRGAGAHRNDEPMRVSDRSELATALIGTGFAYDKPTRALQAEVSARILPEVRDIRRAGTATLDLASVACGRLDGFYEAHMMPWDKAAGALLIREAGGVVSELQAPYDEWHGVIAAGPALHGQLRHLVLGELGSRRRDVG